MAGPALDVRPAAQTQGVFLDSGAVPPHIRGGRPVADGVAVLDHPVRRFPARHA